MMRAAEIQKRERGTATYGITKFSDLTEEEFRNFYLMQKDIHRNITVLYIQEKVATSSPSLHPLPPPKTNWDWSSKGAITPVSNQGQVIWVVVITVHRL